MWDMLYIFALLLVVTWAVGFWGYGAGSIIHLFLVLALVAIIIRLIRRRGRLD